MCIQETYSKMEAILKMAAMLKVVNFYILHLVSPKTLNPWNATIMCAFVSACELSTRFSKIFVGHFEKHQMAP